MWGACFMRVHAHGGECWRIVLGRKQFWGALTLFRGDSLCAINIRSNFSYPSHRLKLNFALGSLRSVGTP